MVVWWRGQQCRGYTTIKKQHCDPQIKSELTTRSDKMLTENEPIDWGGNIEKQKTS